MNDKPTPERADDPAAQLQRSWEANAQAWTDAVRTGRIESRRMATDRAILETILAHHPRRVLDVGCGEGWLARALAPHGVEVVGVDASAPLIAQAQAAGGGSFHTLSYEELSLEPQRAGGDFDGVVCNFSLLSEELTPFLSALRSITQPDGRLHIQTLHPWVAGGGSDYRDGWRTESFSSFGDGWEPMPWYFRTLGSWLESLQAAGWRLEGIQEPLHETTQTPLSLLLVCTSAA